jgi:AmiR/NasT family two-component response regulator
MGMVIVVEQACGMIAEQSSCSVGEALSLLRSRAHARGETIPEVARTVVARDFQFARAVSRSR